MTVELQSTAGGAAGDPTPQLWPGLASPPRAPVHASIARPIVARALRRLPVRMVFPDGTTWGAGDAESPVMLMVRPDAVFHRLGADLRIGFGEAYMCGDWTAGTGTDLADLLTPFAERLTHLVPQPLQKLRGFVDERLPAHEENTVPGAASNIARHYDLSNDLFSHFLDPTMTYSAALFPDTIREAADLDLERAQLRKMDGVLDQARVGPGTQMLEIGTGWGALALRAAQRGALVTTVTISAEQRRLAQRRVAEAGLSDRVEVRLQDYRQVTGEYDAIVSVEVIEAVGERYWPTYFSSLDRLLAPGGRVGLQAITMAHERMLATRRSYGWIHKYIFPGGLIPSMTAIEHTLANHTRLGVLERRDLGWHYGQTLHQWRHRFAEAWNQIATHGFDATFRRMWEFYLAYCEAGFRTGYLGVSQLSLGRAPA
ncbi:MAG: class I SAM-dependent methyltransferase [Nocardioidaceae bacterium]|nr:class I SAM-dependent methyltransferase [Nocardioidaceae bacterium]